MGRQVGDGKGRLGGRAKGTPNRVTQTLKEFVRSLIDDNREQFRADMQALEPRERLSIMEKLLAYVLPKQKEEEIIETQNEITLNLVYNRAEDLIPQGKEFDEAREKARRGEIVPGTLEFAEACRLS